MGQSLPRPRPGRVRASSRDGRSARKDDVHVLGSKKNESVDNLSDERAD
jgi:hypothetical protein